jgi:hypothetical protein
MGFRCPCCHCHLGILDRWNPHPVFNTLNHLHKFLIPCSTAPSSLNQEEPKRKRVTQVGNTVYVHV